MIAWKKEPQDHHKSCPARVALHLNEEGTPAVNTQARCQAGSALPQHLSCLKTQGIQSYKGITNAFIDPNARTLDLPLIKSISITRAAPSHSNTPPGSLSPPYRVCSSPSHPHQPVSSFPSQFPTQQHLHGRSLTPHTQRRGWGGGGTPQSGHPRTKPAPLHLRVPPHTQGCPFYTRGCPVSPKGASFFPPTPPH